MTDVDDDGEDYEATAHIRYEWDCPACSETNDAGDIEPSGDTECDNCGAEVRIR